MLTGINRLRLVCTIACTSVSKCPYTFSFCLTDFVCWSYYWLGHVYWLHLWLHFMPSVLWRCWLGSRKGIRPVKNWAVGYWHGYLSGARCRLAYGPADATATHCLASVKSRLVLPFWYRLTWVVPEKGPLNVCVCVCVCACVCGCIFAPCACNAA